MSSPPCPSRRFILIARSLFPSSNSRFEHPAAANWARREREWEEEKRDAQREYREAMEVIRKRVMQATFGEVREHHLDGGAVVDRLLDHRLSQQTETLGKLEFEEKFGEVLKEGKSPSAGKRGLQDVLDDTSRKLAESEQLERDRLAQYERQALAVIPHGAEAHRPVNLSPQSQLLLLELNHRTLRLQSAQLQMWYFLVPPVTEDRLEVWLPRLDERQQERKAAREERERERRAREPRRPPQSLSSSPLSLSFLPCEFYHALLVHLL
ncbi:hypothetical protein JCM8547_004189 [Rhodosporidiobolus lusitaniae]